MFYNKREIVEVLVVVVVVFSITIGLIVQYSIVDSINNQYFMLLPQQLRFIALERAVFWKR